MPENPTHDSLKPSNGDDDSGEVVRRIQAYLEQLRRRGEPHPASQEEWNRFFQLYSSFFRKLVKRHRWPDEECEDGVQELWLSLITRLPDLQYEPCRGELRDWIAAVARRRLADHERCRRNHPMKRLDWEVADELPARDPDPAAAFECTRINALVRGALAELRRRVSQRDYEAFALRWVDGLSVQDIAHRLGKTEGQVWSIHHRLFRKFRPLLARRLENRPRLDP